MDGLLGPKGCASVVYGLLVLESGIADADRLFHLVGVTTATASKQTTPPAAERTVNAADMTTFVRAASIRGRPHALCWSGYFLFVSAELQTRVARSR